MQNSTRPFTLTPSELEEVERLIVGMPDPIAQECKDAPDMPSKLLCVLRFGRGAAEVVAGMQK